MSNRLKCHVKTGDEVEVISGADKGKRGKVTRVDRARQRAEVTGVRLVRRPVRAGADAKSPDGGIVTMSLPLHVAKLRRIAEGI